MTSKENYLSKRGELQFWTNLDKYLVAFQLNDEDDIVNGCIKDNLGLLEGIPKPTTGYHYLDVINFVGPISKRLFKDEEIDMYQATKVFKNSNIPTFSFKATLTNNVGYFDLISLFKKQGQFVQFPWSQDANDSEWRKGYCVANDIEQAKNLLGQFFNQDIQRRVKDICQEL